MFLVEKLPAWDAFDRLGLGYEQLRTVNGAPSIYAAPSPASATGGPLGAPRPAV